MTMEKRGVISESTPSACCGGGSCQENEKAATDIQQTFPFPDLDVQSSSSEKKRLMTQGKEPDTEKQADDIQDSPLNSAIDAVREETNGSSN